MSAEDSLRNLLLGNGAVAALVGNRVKAIRAEEGTALPFVVFARSNTDPQIDSQGVLLAERVFFEVECWAKGHAEANLVAEACAASIRGAAQEVTSRSALHDPELDLHASIISVEWFETT